MVRMGFFGVHETNVIREAAARLVPGPHDDPLEQDSPGAREANVVEYIDRLLGALDADDPQVYAGGPWSGRAGGGAENHTARFVPLTVPQRKGWAVRSARLRELYSAGIALLDRLAGGDFAAVSPDRQDAILLDPSATQFRDVLFDHTAEGMYAMPEYGGNHDLQGWHSINFLGDRQPEGYPDAAIELGDGPDPVAASPVLDLLLKQYDRAVWFVLGGGQDG
jgi:hypothetical protein